MWEIYFYKKESFLKSILWQYSPDLDHLINQFIFLFKSLI